MRKQIIATALSLAMASAAQAQSSVIVAHWDDGVLQIDGSAAADVIRVGQRNNLIMVNDGEVAISGGVATTFNTTSIRVDAGDGNDRVSLNEFNGALPKAVLLGGSGNDLLIGGSGNDVLLGEEGRDIIISNQGNDFVEGGPGMDLLIWNNGDGSDVFDGGAGEDLLQINGSDADEQIDVSAAAAGQSRVRLQRADLGLYTLDIGSVEQLHIDGGAGNDRIDAKQAGPNVALTLDGNAGNDELAGGDGADVLRGGAGNDTILGNRGNDVVLGENGNDLIVVNEGDGSDLIEGGEGVDVVRVSGSSTAGDSFRIDPNGERVRFRRTNLGLFTLDIGTVENLDVNGQGGSDVIVGSVGLNGLISLDLDGGEGNDLLIGGDDIDFLDGGNGEDRCDGGGGRDQLVSCELKLR